MTQDKKPPLGTRALAYGSSSGNSSLCLSRSFSSLVSRSGWDKNKDWGHLNPTPDFVIRP